MPQFLTVNEAADSTGKSPSSIRRTLLYPIIHKDDHPDRHHVQPSVEEVVQLRAKGDNFAWKLSEELLRRAIPADSVEKGTQSSRDREIGSGDGALVAMLRRELEIKNQQIAQQSELLGRQLGLIGELSERMREGNILIGSLQRQLALPNGQSVVTPRKPEAKARATPTSEKGSRGVAKATKPKGFLSRFFSRSR